MRYISRDKYFSWVGTKTKKNTELVLYITYEIIRYDPRLLIQTDHMDGIYGDKYTAEAGGNAGGGPVQNISIYTQCLKYDGLGVVLGNIGGVRCWNKEPMDSKAVLGQPGHGGKIEQVLWISI